MHKFFNIGKPVTKIDSLALATGNEKFTDDFYVEKPLHIAMLYSNVAHAIIENINTDKALKLNGVVDILHYKNVEKVLHTTAGQGYPEPSPYDTALFNDKVRFVGDRVAVVAAETKEIAIEATKLIEVKYKKLPHNFDPEVAMNPETEKLHGPDAHAAIPVPYDPSKNLAAEVTLKIGNLEQGYNEADFIDEGIYIIHQASHAAIEPHAVVTYFDERGRLVIVTTTQVPFHVRRIVSHTLKYPISNIRVIKPRIGGGFGGKQEVFLEPLAALISIRNKRPARILLNREEVFVSARTRNPMRIFIKTGMKKDGSITVLQMDGLLNTGAYGTHALTVLSNAGAKVLPLFNKIPNMAFNGRSVYTNLPVGGAYRGYGATQGYFAFCQHIDVITRKLDIDILEYYKKWHIKEGETSAVFKVLGEGKEGVAQSLHSCKLSECIDKGAKEIDWYKKRNKKIKAGEDKIKGVGVAVAMQGSGIPRIDMASASMKMNEDGSFNLYIGATDIGTGSDTILAQIAAEVLQTPVEKFIVYSSDTDFTPFDTGAYASSTTYISGGAVKKCAEKIKEQILHVASNMIYISSEELSVENSIVLHKKSGKSVTFSDISYYATYKFDQFQIQAQASHTTEESPAPFMAQFAEINIDIKTGRIEVEKFVTVADCGQAINPKLAEGQIEGAVVNALGYALCEEYLFDADGRMLNKNFWDYKIFNSMDIPEIKTILVESYDETGPFGAKSVGEIAINGALPAIANAVYDAVGIRLNIAPFTPEKVFNKLKEAGIK